MGALAHFPTNLTGLEPCPGGAAFFLEIRPAVEVISIMRDSTRGNPMRTGGLGTNFASRSGDDAQ